MITKTDLKIQNDSYTKKDFYEIYPELLDIFSNMTDKFDPKSSNESDPIIVLLKLLAFTADKINYNIDKSALETKLPSATQENSVKKITEMLGYNMSYMQSAVTPVTFMWQSNDLPSLSTDNYDKSVTLKAFETVLTDDNNSVNYTLTEDVKITNRYVEYKANAIEGSIVQAGINSDNILRIENLDSENKFYLNETAVASNGIFVIDVDYKQRWAQKENLNIRYYDEDSRSVVHTIWKFGYDSSLNKCYIQFNDDINEYIGSGLEIFYTRSSGSKGNINANTLTKLVNTQLEIISTTDENDSVSTVSSDDTLIIKNMYSTNTGKDKETIDEAYSNYKKTINTFDTLISCFDYANYIYNMKNDDYIDNSNSVSNCQVSDIRTDINNSFTLATYLNSTKYISLSEKKTASVYGQVTEDQDRIQWDTEKEGEEKALIERIAKDSSSKIKVEIKQASMDNFDLYIYPLNPINTSYNAENYRKSFKPIQSSEEINSIIEKLQDTKCIAHKIKQGGQDSTDCCKSLYLIKNYYKLNAKINTKNKVNAYEILDIKNNIYSSLYENFNSHNLEYGEEIPYDSLLNVITNSDSRIKAVSLEEPELETRYMLADGTEGILSSASTLETDRIVYRNLVLKNVLAGRAPLFNYINKLNLNYTETNDSVENGFIYGSKNNYADSVSVDKNTGEIIKGSKINVNKNNSITYLSTNLALDCSKLNFSSDSIDTKYTLRENESIAIINPKFVTTDTFTSYVSYYFKSNMSEVEINYSDICNLKELNTDSISEFGDSSIKTVKDLVTHLAKNTNLTIYKRNKQNLNSSAGYLVDNDLYSYSICGSKVGSYYKTAWEYNSNSTYFIEKSFQKESKDSSYLNYDVYKGEIKEDGTIEIVCLPYSVWDQYNVTLNNENLLLDKKEINWNDSSSPNQYKKNIGNTSWILLKRYTIGAEQYNNTKCIKANTNYSLEEGEALYVSLVDSDNVDHAYKYYLDSEKNYVVEDKGIKISDSSFSGIISPTFDLYPSESWVKMNGGHSYSKTSSSNYGKYYIDKGEIEGMFSLDTEDELNIKANSKAEMKEQCYLYWLCNNNNTLKFELSDIQSKSENLYIYTYEYVLNQNEYLWYANTAKTSMVTLGYGNKLSLTLTSSSKNPSKHINWSRQEKQDITLSDISKNGIGTFSEGDWVLKNFNNSYYLTTEQMEITYLNEGTEIIGINLKEDYSSQVINSDSWYEIDSIKYRKDSSVIEYDSNKHNLSSFSYRIKPILNINMGPATVQSLSDSTDNIAKQDMQIFTSYWCYKSNNEYTVIKNKDIVNELTYNKNNIYEYIVDSTPLNVKNRDKEDSSSSNSYFNESLKSNYALNISGGKAISVHTSTLNSSEYDDFEIYPLTKISSVLKINGEEKQFEKNNTITLYQNTDEKANYIQLQTLTLENSLGIFSCVLNNTGEGTALIKVLNTNSNEVSGMKTIENYLYDDESSWEESITLSEGLNTIVINRGCTLMLEGNATFSIKVLNYNLIDANNSSLNVEYLGLKESEINSFLAELKAKLSDIDYKFYYNVDIDSSKFIEVSTLNSPYSWFNSNNLYKIFTISELDLKSFENIDISRSSRLS